MQPAHFAACTPPRCPAGAPARLPVAPRRVAPRAAAEGAAPAAPAAATTLATETETEVFPGVFEGWWRWEGHAVRYLRCGDAGPPVLCVHGFGGNASHWRNNLPVLGATCRAYAIDLLGYGFSDKPDPRAAPVNSIYNFETWGRQIRAFITEVLGGAPTLVTCNSVGGIAGLQAACDDPSLVSAVQIMNVSLRMLHTSKQAPWARPLVAALQTALRTTPLGPLFFGQVATRQGVRSVLRQCYADPAAVTDELVELILQPGLQPGAVHVFLDFISYSGGPLAEDLLAGCTVPVSVLWGAEDPWEKVEWGRGFATYPAVEEFVELPGAGHCPMCERPDLVNPLITAWVGRHAQV